MNQPGTQFVEIAVLGGDDALRTAVREAGGSVVRTAEADAIVAAGESALREATEAAAGTPVLPVGVGDSPHSVSPQRAPAALGRLVRGEGRVVSHPRLTVAVAGETVGDALLDATLVTGDPGRISEYGVTLDGDPLDSFRADAVVAATPLGSGGYAAAAGGAKLAADTGLVVVPIAPFQTRSDTWVVPDRVTLTVERDEGPVDLVIDDEVRRTVPAHEPVDVTAGGDVPLVRVPSGVQSAE
ncbi:NAD(+)/NADH kinase [Haloparvum sedimenti]|uniref:NAD(+)/NADH kinase n=1 Tax=Haloparvum sedimenti TaxID=1678448 RepID=UPI00071E889C|nr:NAD(+)/NADH kinase [Haloparvum sedimenti]